jgi:RNA polymerase sigma factor, sigma-70 family
MGEELLTVLISQMKKSQNNLALEKIIIKMQPLVKKYTRKLYFMEKEDATQELILALIESVNHIKKYDNEAMCITYLHKSIINKYYYLCKLHIKLSQMEDEFAEISDNLAYIDKFNIIELLTDLQKLLKNKNDNQKQIIKYIFVDELSDSEISLKMNISRQYINRIKKKILDEYLE